MSSPFLVLFGTQFNVFKVNNDGPFFRTSKQRFACVTEKKVSMVIMMILIVMVIILMIMMKKLAKKTNIVTFQHKCTNFWDLYLVKKKGQQIEIGDGDLGGCSMLPVRKTNSL